MSGDALLAYCHRGTRRGHHRHHLSKNCGRREVVGFKNHIYRGFPGGAVVKNPPANAGDYGFEPWSWKIPHAAEQLSLCATTTEPAL